MNTGKSDCCNLNMIVSVFYKLLLNYLKNNNVDTHIAEDIVQEVMLKVVSAHKKSVKVENIKAWLYQITRNTLIDYYRKANNIIQNTEEFIDEMFILHENSDNYLNEYLIPIIQLLPEKYSIPLILSDIKNIQQSEVAKIINVSLSATKMRIQRATPSLPKLFINS